jgi:hypothetical protein
MNKEVVIEPLRCPNCGLEFHFQLQCASGEPEPESVGFTGQVFDHNGTELRVGDKVFGYDPTHNCLELTEGSLEIFRIESKDSVLLKIRGWGMGFTFRNPDKLILYEREC